MKPDPLTNDTLMTTDFARAEKIICLQSTCRFHHGKNIFPDHGNSAHSVWMTDVSAMDPRSVKAQLVGRGDWRVAWWQLNDLLHGWLLPRSTLEQRMYAFHARHHALTLARMTLINDYRCIYRIVLREGVMAALRYATRKAFTTGEQP